MIIDSALCCSTACARSNLWPAADYSPYQGGTGGYSELFWIASGYRVHTNNVLVENNTFLEGKGDSTIT
jgi:hypothetical protein